MVPSIVGPDEVGRVMGAGQALNTLAAVAAPATAGLLVGTIGYGAPFVVDAATFVCLAVAATAITTTRHVASAEPAEEPVGFSVWRDPLLRTLILGVCALVLAGEMTNVVEVFLVRGTLGAGTLAFGLVGAGARRGRRRRGRSSRAGTFPTRGVGRAPPSPPWRSGSRSSSPASRPESGSSPARGPCSV